MSDWHSFEIDSEFESIAGFLKLHTHFWGNIGGVISTWKLQDVHALKTSSTWGKNAKVIGKRNPIKQCTMYLIRLRDRWLKYLKKKKCDKNYYYMVTITSIKTYWFSMAPINILLTDISFFWCDGKFKLSLESCTWHRKIDYESYCDATFTGKFNIANANTYCATRHSGIKLLSQYYNRIKLNLSNI